MPRAGLTTARVVDEAEAVADEVGLAALSLATIAGRLGVRVPSLYKHIDGLDALHRLIAASAKAELADELERAVAGVEGAHLEGDDAILAVAHAYRDWATAHPGRYPSTLRAPDTGNPAEVAAGERATTIVFRVLEGYGLRGDDAVDATRALRATLHGFVALEAAGGFGMPVDVDRSFDRAVRALTRALAHW